MQYLYKVIVLIYEQIVCIFTKTKIVSHGRNLKVRTLYDFSQKPYMYYLQQQIKSQFCTISVAYFDCKKILILNIIFDDIKSIAFNKQVVLHKHLISLLDDYSVLGFSPCRTIL